MSRLLILLASFLCVAGFVSMAWAHGPNGYSSSFRSYGYSQPQFSGSFHPRSGFGAHRHHQHRGHSRYGSLPYSQRNHLRRGSVLRQSRRLSRIERDIIHNNLSPLENRLFNNQGFGISSKLSPLENRLFNNQGFGVSPLRKTLKRKVAPQDPHHSHSPHSYYRDNPEPWFLYGKGKEFRQMGLIPPLPQTSQELK